MKSLYYKHNFRSLECYRLLVPIIILLLLLFCSYKRFGREVFRGIAGQIGWLKKENEDPLDTMLRPIVIGAMTLYADPEYTAIARDKFWKHIQGRN